MHLKTTVRTAIDCTDGIHKEFACFTENSSVSRRQLRMNGYSLSMENFTLFRVGLFAYDDNRRAYNDILKKPSATNSGNDFRDQSLEEIACLIWCHRIALPSTTRVRRLDNATKSGVKTFAAIFAGLRPNLQQTIASNAG